MYPYFKGGFRLESRISKRKRKGRQEVEKYFPNFRRIVVSKSFEGNLWKWDFKEGIYQSKTVIDDLVKKYPHKWMRLGNPNRNFLITMKERFPTDPMDKGIRDYMGYSALTDEEIRHLIIEICADELAKEGWRLVENADQSRFIRQQERNATVRELIQAESTFPIGHDQKILIIRSLLANVRKIDDHYYLGFDIRSSLRSADTIQDGPQTRQKNRNFYFSCPKYSCSAAFTGECTFSLQFNSYPVYDLNITKNSPLDKIIKLKDGDEKISIKEYYDTPDNCVTKEWVKTFGKTSQFVVKAKRSKKGKELDFPANGIRWSVRYHELSMENREKVMDLIQIAPKDRWDEILQILNSVKSVKFLDFLFQVKGPEAIPKYQRINRPQIKIGNSLTDREHKLHLAKRIPYTRPPEKQIIGVFYTEFDQSIQDLFEQYFCSNNTIQYRTRRSKLRKITSYPSTFCINKVELKLIKFEDDIQDIDAILFVGPLEVHEERNKWRSIARNNNIGFKSMKPDMAVEELKIKLDNIGVGLFLSSVGNPWILATKKRSFIGIDVDYSIVSAALVSDQGIIEKNCTWTKSDQLAEAVKSLIERWGKHSILISGLISDVQVENFSKVINCPVVRIIEQPNGLRLFNNHKDRKIKHSCITVIGSNELLVLSSSAEYVFQGTPMPMKMNYFGFDDDDEKFKVAKDILSFTFIHPWYTRNFSKLPLPLKVANRMNEKEPLDAKDLQDTPLKDYDNAWFT